WLNNDSTSIRTHFNHLIDLKLCCFHYRSWKSDSGAVPPFFYSHSHFAQNLSLINGMTMTACKPMCQQCRYEKRFSLGQGISRPLCCPRLTPSHASSLSQLSHNECRRCKRCRRCKHQDGEKYRDTQVLLIY